MTTSAWIRLQKRICIGPILAGILILIFALLIEKQTRCFSSAYYRWYSENIPRHELASRVSQNLFERLVESRADDQKRVFIALVDTGYAEMAFNFYITSFVNNSIENYIFVGADETACRELNRLRIAQNRQSANLACVTYFHDRNGIDSSVYGSPAFIRKNHYKSKIILIALRLGLQVIIVDLDIVFFKNPLPYLNCTHCDIEFQDDLTEGGNGGFYLARPTSSSIALHEKALELATVKVSLSHQRGPNKVLNSMKKQGSIKFRMLSRSLFPCGRVFFGQMRITFRGDMNCDECVIVHNNWIVRTAKIYRFKEVGLWHVDTDHYYSDSARKYLTYDNAVDFGRAKSLEQETKALQAALFIGYLLNRTVVLPAFHSNHLMKKGKENRIYALSALYSIKKFDDAFGNAYREHSFLSHPQVPAAVRNSQSEIMLIETYETKSLPITTQVPSNLRYTPRSQMKVEPQEIVDWFGKMTSYSVLRFHSMYGVSFSDQIDVVNSPTYKNVIQKLKKAFAPRKRQ